MNCAICNWPIPRNGSQARFFEGVGYAHNACVGKNRLAEQVSGLIKQSTRKSSKQEDLRALIYKTMQAINTAGKVDATSEIGQMKIALAVVNAIQKGELKPVEGVKPWKED